MPFVATRSVIRNHVRRANRLAFVMRTEELRYESDAARLLASISIAYHGFNIGFRYQNRAERRHRARIECELARRHRAIDGRDVSDEAKDRMKKAADDRAHRLVERPTHGHRRAQR